MAAKTIMFPATVVTATNAIKTPKVISVAKAKVLKYLDST